jgi:hypothetical protein
MTAYVVCYIHYSFIVYLFCVNTNSFQTNNSEYNFYLTICDVPKEAREQDDSIGLIQEKMNDNSTQYALGRLSNVDLEGSGMLMIACV